MGFFSKPKEATETLRTCALCHQDFPEERFNAALGICSACAVITIDYVDNYLVPSLQRYEDSANAATDPDDKIAHYTALLETLYEYKIKYQDNDVKLMKHDVSDDIAGIVDKISHVRD